MSKKLIYTIIGISCLILSFLGPTLYKKPVVQEKPLPSQIVSIKAGTIKKITRKPPKPAKQTEPVKEVVVKEKTEPRHSPKKVILKRNNIAMSKVSFDELPGWDKADVKKSLLAFQKSCATFLKQSPSHPLGSGHFKLKAKDWHPACKAAVELESVTDDTAKAFFEKWFHPIEFARKKSAHGLFTGYYMPEIKGNLTQSAEFNTPIYGLPKRRYVNSFTREQIDNDALKEKAPVLAWTNSAAERLFLEIEGSGAIKLPNGKTMYLNYAGENGAPYTSVAKVLINKGLLSRHKASKKAIIRYLEEHPSRAKSIIQKNKSFVFFKRLKKPAAVGVKDMTLTPGYSLAVDKKWIPIGAPLWLDTKRPTLKQADNEKQFQRLMIAQDTGGAIRGFMRGDIYWGSGELAAFLGEHMKNEGQYWLLLPKHIINRFAKRH